MANTWKCRMCGAINDVTDEFRQCGDTTCSECMRGRYLPIKIGSISVVILIGLCGLVYWMSGLGERNYRAKYVEFKQSGNGVDTQEQETLKKLAHQYGLSEKDIARIEGNSTPPQIVRTEDTRKKPEPEPQIKGDQSAKNSKYAITVYRKTPKGEQVSVSPEYAFRNGDEIRLSVESKQDGYLYLVQKGSSGRLNMIYPQRRIAGGAHSIKSNQEVMIPAEGWFKFDNRTGTETIFAVFSPKPDPKFLALITQTSPRRQTSQPSQAELIAELEHRSQEINPAPVQNEKKTSDVAVLSNPETVVAQLTLAHQR